MSRPQPAQCACQQPERTAAAAARAVSRDGRESEGAATDGCAQGQGGGRLWQQRWQTLWLQQSSVLVRFGCSCRSMAAMLLCSACTRLWPSGVCCAGLCCSHLTASTFQLTACARVQQALSANFRNLSWLPDTPFLKPFQIFDEPAAGSPGPASGSLLASPASRHAAPQAWDHLQAAGSGSAGRGSKYRPGTGFRVWALEDGVGGEGAELCRRLQWWLLLAGNAGWGGPDHQRLARSKPPPDSPSARLPDLCKHRRVTNVHAPHTSWQQPSPHLLPGGGAPKSAPLMVYAPLAPLLMCGSMIQEAG